MLTVHLVSFLTCNRKLLHFSKSAQGLRRTTGRLCRSLPARLRMHMLLEMEKRGKIIASVKFPKFFSWKSRSYVAAWQTTLRVHEMMAENRLRFSQRLNEMSEELSILAKEIERNRKQVGKVQIY